MFLVLEKLRARLSAWLKKKTTIDFSDWANLTLLILGVWAIFFFGNSITAGEKFSAIVLWFTAIVIIQYTKETYWLKQTNTKLLEVNRKQLINQEKPIVKIDSTDGIVSVTLSNIGKGPAFNIETRISQIHENGGFTNLGNLLGDDERSIFSLGMDERYEVEPESDIFDDYIHAIKDQFRWGQKSVFAVIATYEDINRKPYYSIALFRVNRESSFILKSIKTGDYSSGNLESVFPSEWIR